jgi:hypothetical protein
MKDNSGIIVNRVAKSGILTLNLEDFYPQTEIASFDVKDYLFMNMILKEKDFRKALKELDWSVYADKMVSIFCSVDAIVPVWAYMLVATKLDGVAKNVVFGTPELAKSFLFQETLQQVDLERYRDKMVVVKGCGKKDVPAFAYVEIARLLKPIVKKLMYGEPCSTVPLYKQPRK